MPAYKVTNVKTGEVHRFSATSVEAQYPSGFPASWGDAGSLAVEVDQYLPKTPTTTAPTDLVLPDGKGLIATSPDGTQWKLTPSNSGAPVWTKI